MTPGSNPARTIDFRFAPPVVFTSICRPDDPHKTLVRQDSALPSEWLRPDAEVRVDRTPTRFGAVSLHLRCDAQGEPTLSYSLDATWPRKPASIRVRIPDRVGEMDVNGVKQSGTPGVWIDLPA